MTELSFLIKLLLNDLLPKELKQEIADRIKEVESNLVSKPQQLPSYIPTQAAMSQAPSTLAAMVRHGDLSSVVPPPDMPVAQTPAAAAALSQRAALISAAEQGKAPMKSRAFK